jgi:hypothetical protein
VPISRRSFAAAVSAFCLFVPVQTGIAHAQQEFAPPTGEVMLKIDGKVAAKNSEEGLLLDLAMLKAMPVTTIKTTTQWTEGMQTFTGVSLKLLLDTVGADGTTVSAVALNDYIVPLDIAALEQEAPIVAYEINGETFSRRDKGPLWIIYPYDLGDKYQTEEVFAQSVWQLLQLTVE